MTREEYNERLSELKKEFAAAKRLLGMEYAESNRVANKGDIVVDHFQTIRVEAFKYIPTESCATTIYFGPLLTKSGKPYKNGKVGTVHGTNIKTVNGKEV